MSLVPDRPISYLITRGEATSGNFDLAKRQILDIIAIAVEEKVSMVQIREKKLSARLVCDLTAAAVESTRGTATKILVNDRVDVALACGADGVHLTSTSIGANVVRQFVPGDFLLGVSTHSLDDVQRAANNGAYLAVLGPIFATPGKTEPLGLEVLAETCNAVKPFPVLALGGVDENNTETIMAAGASGFAAIKAMNDPGRLKKLMFSVRSR